MLPYPGVFVLDERGVVVRKRFHDGSSKTGYWTWTGCPAPSSELESRSDEKQARASSSDPVGIRAWLDSPTYAWFQHLLLTVEVVTDPGSRGARSWRSPRIRTAQRLSGSRSREVEMVQTDPGRRPSIAWRGHSTEIRG